MKQLAMKLPTWGGRRKGAGRMPKGRVALVSHEQRPELDGRTPVHVVMRVRDDVRSLRARATFLAMLAAFAAARERSGLRLIHYSVLGNHLHLIVEADDREALSRQIQGLAIRLARAINRAQDRKGRVFSDHYFGHPLRTPAEVRHAIHYVEQNQRLHAARRPPRAGGSRRVLVGRQGRAGLSAADLALAHRLAPRPRKGAMGRAGPAMRRVQVVARRDQPHRAGILAQSSAGP